jgi:hypothetical protein
MKSGFQIRTTLACRALRRRLYSPDDISRDAAHNGEALQSGRMRPSRCMRTCGGNCYTGWHVSSSSRSSSPRKERESTISKNLIGNLKIFPTKALRMLRSHCQEPALS